jgi:hypothetical protein
LKKEAKNLCGPGCAYLDRRVKTLKSLLLLFFRKEDSSLLALVRVTALTCQAFAGWAPSSPESSGEEILPGLVLRRSV